MKRKSNTSPYSKIFGNKSIKKGTCRSENQLLGFTVLYDADANRMNREELLDKIAELSPSPHNIFHDKEGYLLRFELDKTFDVEDEAHENLLRESILNFLEKNNVVAGKLQEMEIGKWETNLVLLDDDDDGVMECL